jgi:lysophospholipase L1-like esterase
VKASNILLFILSVIMLLGIISFFFPEEGVALGKKDLYFPTIEDIFTRKEGDSISVSQRMKEMKESLRIQQYKDSLYEDSLSFYITFFQNHPSKINLPENNWNYFNDLFERFDECKNQNEVVHILHYGDSQIEGDRITGYIRQKLQEKFGGNGPGLLPAVQPIPSAAVGQSASENINRYIISGSHQNRISHSRYGVLGQVGIIAGESALSFNTRNWKETFENVKEFQNVRLFVGHTGANFKASLISPNKEVLKGSPESNDSPVKVFSWKLTAPIKKFTLRTYGSGEIYGIALDGTAGIAMDNVPFRGSSGTFFSTIDSIVMDSMLRHLNVKLILLEFGGNMVPSIRSDKSIANYKAKMAEQIAYLRKLHPDIKIILIGPADMDTKVNGKLQTHPYLEKTIEALKEAALENDAAFWNMYEVMGGKNSMIDWVKNSPSLAAPDYIHFNVKGADRIAELFYESFMLYYDYYHFVSQHEKELLLEKKR